MTGTGDAAADAGDAPRTANILLVDDVPANLVALAAVLEPLGHTLVTAKSGTEALREILRESFAVILMDVQMPDLDGFQTVELIKQRPKTANLPIIFVTAIAKEAELVARGYQFGAVDYVTKPFDADILRAKVSGIVALHLETERALRQQELLRKRQEELHRLEVEHAAACLAQERAARAAIERTEKRARFLAEASRLLASLDSDASLAAVAHLCVPFFADWCVVDILEPHGAIRRFVAADGDSRQTVAHRLEEYPGVLFPQESDLFRNLGKGDPCTTDDAIALEAQKAVSDLGFRSCLAVPMAASGTTLGAMVFVSAHEQRRYEALDVVLAEDLAARAALTIANARLYQRVENALRARDEFLSIASHELRTPITSLTLTAQGLLEGAYSKAPIAEADPMMKPLCALHRQTKRLTRLVSDMLDVARMQAGHLELRLESIDLVKVVREVIERFEVDAARAVCGLSLSASGPAVGSWDHSRLDQVVSNLLSNALRYGAHKPVEIEVRNEGDNALVVVRDHGIGIEQDRIADIFKRFERAVSSWRYGGLGLGLYIARQIVERHGGSIHVQSQLGVGSTFTVALPFSHAEKSDGPS